MREAALAREMREAGAPEVGYLYMGEPSLCDAGRTNSNIQGFYIHSCQKMRYKGDYSPSYLADPVRVLDTGSPSFIYLSNRR